MDHEQLTIIFDILEGLTPNQWEKVKMAVDHYYEQKTSELKRQLQLAGSDEMLKVYEQLF